MFRLKIPRPVFAAIMLVAGPVLAQQRLPTIFPEQYTAEHIPRDAAEHSALPVFRRGPSPVTLP